MKELRERLGKLGKKAIIIAVSFLVLIIIIIFGGAFLYNKFFYKRSYTEIESIMLRAAQNYMSKNKDALPAELNGTVNLSVNDLVRTEDMKPISEYTKDETVSCDGNVIITNINHQYRYTPILNCGDKYETVKFIDYVKKQQPIVQSGNGLYLLNEEMVFRGDNVNNYLQLAGKNYRIVKFSSDEAVIIYDEKFETHAWDDRYNVSKQGNVGINDYSVSVIRDYLNELYRGNSFLAVDKKTNFDPKSVIVSYRLDIGKRGNADTDKSGTLEKSAVMENQFIGLLPAYDYMNASLDANCTTIVSPSCMNYNYLSRYTYNWWLGTATNSNSYNVYRISKKASLVSANSFAYSRPVLHLAKDVLYVSGDGSSENPYIIK